MPSPRQRKKMKNQGFTLIEVMLAMVMIAVLMGMIFGVVSGVLQLGETTVQVMEESRRESEAERFIRQVITDQPAASVLSLENEGDESVLEFTETATAFPLGGRELSAKWVRFYETRTRDGLREIRVEMGTRDEDDGGRDEGEISSVLLKTDLSYVRWECFDSALQDWVTEWAEEQGKPIHVRLVFKEASLESEQVILFWLPVKQLPN